LTRLGRYCLLMLLFMVVCTVRNVHADAPEKQMVIIDTDIGDDIDDAFAVALALSSPEIQILQINSDFGDTPMRTRLLNRFLAAAGRQDIPIGTGIQTSAPDIFSQRSYAQNGTAPAERDAIQSTLDLIRENPGKITLISIGPCSNIGAMIDKDAETFHKLRRVVMMGGSVYLGGGDLGYTKPHGPDPEWNILQDIDGARKLLASGVPIYMMPLDATQLKFDEVKRNILFRHDSPLTDQLLILYYQWGHLTPTLFDPMAVAFAVDPGLCPVAPLHLIVDDKGYTRIAPGRPNVEACLHSDPETFFRFYIPRVLGQ